MSIVVTRNVLKFLEVEWDNFRIQSQKFLLLDIIVWLVRNNSNFWRKIFVWDFVRRALKAFHTQTEVIYCISDCVDLQVLPVVFTRQIEWPCQVTAASERLIHTLSVNLQAWHLIHRHAFNRSSERGKENGEKKETKIDIASHLH